MRRSTTGTLALAGFVVGGLWFAGVADAQQKGEILIGSQCDRTGPTQLVATVFCPAVQDYVNLINAKGGVDGWKVRHQRDRQQLPGAGSGRGISSGTSRRAPCR